MRTILTTVGTSLWANARRDLKLPHDAPISKHEHDLTNYLRQTPPEKASAETNSLKRLLQEGDRIIFIHSDTEEGRLCADALKSFYQKNHSVETKGVDRLNYTDSEFKMVGLRSFVTKLIEQIRNEQKASREVIINATGGFKAEIAYATLVGLLFNVPVYYIHEAFQDIIEMPPTPIAWDYSLIDEYEEFFEWIDEQPRKTDEVEQQLERLPERDRIRMLLIDEPDGNTYLSPAGEAFYQAYRMRLATEPDNLLWLSSKARETYDSLSPDARERFRKVLGKLRKPSLRRSQSRKVPKGNCLIYPKGNRDERVIFYEKNDKVYVCELTWHSDQTYERRIEKSVRRDEYKDFTPFEE